MLAAIREAEAVYDKLNALTGPRSLYRAADETGGVAYVEIFTWRSGDIPDNAPPEIQAVWKKLESLAYNRKERRGIEFYAIETLSGGSSPRAAAPSR